MRCRLQVRHGWWTFPSLMLDSCVTRCVTLKTFDKCARTPPVLVVRQCAQSPSIVLLAVPKNRPTTAVPSGSLDPDQFYLEGCTSCKLACSTARVRDRVQSALQITPAQVLKHCAYTSSPLPTDVASKPIASVHRCRLRMRRPNGPMRCAEQRARSEHSTEEEEQSCL